MKFIMKRNILVALFFILLFQFFMPSYLYGETKGRKEDSRSFKTRIESSARSFVLTGWGQVYNDQPIKGLLFFGSEVAVLTTAFIFGKISNDYDNEYQTATNPDDAMNYYKKANDYYKLRNAFLWTSLGVWAYNVIDAYMNATVTSSGKKMAKFPLYKKNKNISLNSILVEKEKLIIVLSIKVF